MSSLPQKYEGLPASQTGDEKMGHLPGACKRSQLQANAGGEGASGLAGMESGLLMKTTGCPRGAHGCGMKLLQRRR